MISHGYCFRFVFLDLFSITLKEFSRLHYCLIFKVLRCQLRDSFVNISQLVGICQQLFSTFFKTFFYLRSSHESYNGLWFFVVSFVVLCRLSFDDFAILPKHSGFGNTLFSLFYTFVTLDGFYNFITFLLCIFTILFQKPTLRHSFHYRLAAHEPLSRL